MSERPLSFFERFMLAEGAAPPFCFMAARLAGPLDEAAARRALDALRAAYPVLRMTIGMRNGTPWFVAPEVAPALPLRFVAAEDWAAVARTELAGLATLGGEPLLRAVVVTGAPDRACDVVVFCPHCVADGLAILTLLRAFLAALYRPDQAVRGQAMLPDPVETIAAEERLRHGRRASRMRLAARVMLSAGRLWRRRERTLDGNAVLNVSLGAERTAALRTAIRARRSNMLFVLTVAFLRAFRIRRGRRATGRVLGTIDARAYLAGVHRDQMFPVADNVQLSLRRPAGKAEFWNEVAEIGAMFERRLGEVTLVPRLMAGRGIERLAPTLVRLVRNSPARHDTVLAHLGTPLALAPDAPWRHEGFVGGSASMPWANSTLVTTGIGGGALRLTMVARAPTLPEEEARGILACAVEELSGACGAAGVSNPEQ